MKKPRILLVQARARRDPMLAHERECIRRRLGGDRVTLETRNAVAEPADSSWLLQVDGVILGGSGDFSVHHPFSRPWVTPLRGTRFLSVQFHPDLTWEEARHRYLSNKRDARGEVPAAQAEKAAGYEAREVTATALLGWFIETELQAPLEAEPTPDVPTGSRPQPL